MTSNYKEYWLSVYVYFDGNIYSDYCDDVIRDILAPFIGDKENQKYFEKYFFIRYSDSGSHLRIRFLGDPEKLKVELKPYFEYSVKKKLAVFIANNNMNDEKFFVRWVPYEPEYKRYGGEEAIKIAEEFFYYSSETAIEIIKLLSRGDKASRLGKGLALMVILLQRFYGGDKEKAAKLVASYSSGYLKAIAKEEKYHEAWVECFDTGFNTQSEKLIELVNSILTFLTEGEELPYPLNNYSEHLETVAKKLRSLCVNKGVLILQNPVENWETCLSFIIPSYLHMMNNRLGITIQEEAYLAHLISKGIEVENFVK